MIYLGWWMVIYIFKMSPTLVFDIKKNKIFNINYLGVFIVAQWVKILMLSLLGYGFDSWPHSEG